MDTETRTPEELVRLFWEGCWSQRRTDQLGDIFHDPFVFGEIEGPLDRLIPIFQEAFSASNDLAVQVRSLHRFGDTVVTRSWLRGTHTGDLLGVPGTGKEFRSPMLDVFVFRDGKVQQYLHLADHLPVLSSLGAEVRVGNVLATLD